ncbi:putative FBD-associated F-box protein At1g05080 isoform X1 [Brassica napus]|uniref:putative FBD-associated F-box protein At1g05080 isoform X1 n=1 Tax=Brassica napus TaxID=3708 RepID=UPI00207A3356|nr:putative FBD-associated F-box protein At1g05080 isoform X1 [Brassica napus]
MLRQLLSGFSSIHVGLQVGYLISILIEKGIPILLEQTSRRFPKRKVKSFGVEDRISALPDDLLVRILLLVPTKDALATMILSKRWRSIWTMVPKLDYLEMISDDTNKVVIGGLLGRLLERFFGRNDQKRLWLLRFIDESLQAHKAPVLEALAIGVDRGRHVDVVDVGNWIKKAVHSRVRELGFILRWSAEPTRLPNNLYTCDTLVSLGLSNKILVDVPSPACLPSLKYLILDSVVYKDEDSLARFLSSCPLLKTLIVERHHQDNVKVFNIKAPFLVFLSYHYVKLEPHGEAIEGSLVIDSPALKKIFITDHSRDSYSIENEPRLEKANINFRCYPDDRFRTSLSSVMCLELVLSFATVCGALFSFILFIFFIGIVVTYLRKNICINTSRGFTYVLLCSLQFSWFSTIGYSYLMECKIILVHDLDWLQPLMFLLQNSPNLKVLLIDKTFIQVAEELPLSWNQPSSVPGCLSTHLEIFEWREYKGRNEEREFINYIFANSKCLKRAGFSLKSTGNHKDRKNMKDLESMYRVSTSSQLLFSTQVEYMSVSGETRE